MLHHVGAQPLRGEFLFLVGACVVQRGDRFQRKFRVDAERPLSGKNTTQSGRFPGGGASCTRVIPSQRKFRADEERPLSGKNTTQSGRLPVESVCWNS